jgi:hypothetical protein
MGSEHAVSDEQGVRARLESELTTMGAGPQEPLVDPISPSGEIVRVHLRPYLGARHDPEQLLEAFLRTAYEVRGSTERLRRDWQAAERMVLAGQLPFAPDEDMSRFMQCKERQGFPAMHHSRIYERSYRPAYRVVARTFLNLVARV